MRTCLALVLALAQSGGAIRAGDWPMYGRDATRNAAIAEAHAPSQWSVGQFDPKTGKWQPDQARNIKWVAPLGILTYGDPVVACGLVWVGTNSGGSGPDASVLACFRESDGQALYRYVSPRLPQGREYDWPSASLACSPLVEGDRLWFTTNRCETVCLDIGPLLRGDGQPRVAWKVDMLQDLGVCPKGSPMTLSHICSPAGYRDWLYVITGHAIDAAHERVARPEAPSLVCFDKQTGKVVWSDNTPGRNILHGQWSSPLAAEIGGVAQVVAPQGDGWVRSFEAATGKLLWEFDVNAKPAVWQYGGRGDRNILLASPVLYDGRIYIASGRHPEFGEGPGRLCCLDPTKRGDISRDLVVDRDGLKVAHRRVQAVDASRGEKAVPNPNVGLVWEFTKDGDRFEDELHSTVSNVAIQDGLVILPDNSGLVHCFDARTGKRHWSFDMLASILASPLIVGRQVYVADMDGNVMVFPLSADPRVALGGKPEKDRDENNVEDSVDCSPVFAHGTLYVASRKRLFAIAQSDAPQAGATRAGPPPAPAERPSHRPPPRNKEPDAIFVPTPHDVVAKMLELADVKKTDLVMDLGSGDGRIVIAAAKTFGARAVGIELDENLVRQSQAGVDKAGLGERVRIEHADIFAQDLSAADVIALYLPPKLMDRLLPQLARLKPGARVVSHFFQFTDIPPQKSLRMDSRDDGDGHEIYLWTAPLKPPAP